MKNLSTALSVAVLLAGPLAANGAPIGPTPYLSSADAPFAATSFTISILKTSRIAYSTPQVSSHHMEWCYSPPL